MKKPHTTYPQRYCSDNGHFQCELSLTLFKMSLGPQGPQNIGSGLQIKLIAIQSPCSRALPSYSFI